MKVIAAVCADFDQSFLGLPSRLNRELCGETVVRRTLKQLTRTAGLASIHLLVDASQERLARSAVGGLNVGIETHNAGRPPWSEYVAAGRKWSLDAWRGGLAGTTVYDEFAHPWLLESLARREAADAVVDVPAAAPLLSSRLLGDLIRHFETVRGQVRVALMQTAPGLSAIIYQPDMLADLAKSVQPPGRTMTYRPDDPHKDVIHQPCLCATDAVISHGWGRCVADTHTAIGRLERILAELRPPNPETAADAVDVSKWLKVNQHRCFDAVPQEIEIEITTEDPLCDSLLRPRGAALRRRGEMDFGLYKRIVDELAACDDRLLVLGGHGDPLLHPLWPEFVRYTRNRGVLGIAVRTTGLGLSDEAIEALIEARVDALNILLDATTPETYRKVHRSDVFEAIIANIGRLGDVQQQRSRPRPLIVCEMTKTADTMSEMEPFYDHWMRKTGSAVIVGPSHYAGQWPDRAVAQMAPPARFACGKVFHRATILSDGRLSLCDQDFRGSRAIGSLQNDSLAGLWRGSRLSGIREYHLNGSFESIPLCRDCAEWHRP